MEKMSTTIETRLVALEKAVFGAKPAGPSLMAKAAQIAEAEAKTGLTWRNNGGAQKYTRKFEHVFGKGRFPWCAAFVTWCMEEAGLIIPLKAPETGYTFALCEAWQQWAKSIGFYYDNAKGFVPNYGDIVLFDWDNAEAERDDDWEDHIGFYLAKGDGVGVSFESVEGNRGDKVVKGIRRFRHVEGYIRIPDDFTF
jgi:hypothetical protein